MNDYIAAIHLALNSYHTPWLDKIMVGLSNSANWLPYVLCLTCLILSVVVLSKGRIWGLLPTLAQGISLAIVQPLKHLINEPRPLTFFTNLYPDVKLPLAEGVTMHYYLSFPSGHTATFFALALGVILWHEECEKIVSETPKAKTIKKKYKISLYIALLLYATIASYSRIYLSQHFLHDVLFGMLAGLISAYFAKLILQKTGKTNISAK